MENSQMKYNLIILIIVFGSILLSQFIFNLEGSFTLLFLIYFINVILISKHIKDKEIKLNKKMILISIIFLLSNLIIFYNYDFKDIKNYLIWFFIILIVSVILNIIDYFNKNKKLNV
ncbi:hypothetical protein [Senegalia massiliensis]|uniref:Uncharacterized protein n=1 Tax=Senegalia massiliensis TaxID=1720316 RepID=A0A845R0X5_9CLOT|nr:hypothetical protein [Senegalia massiliensis]NBI08355.1 hypothetical protein [Senegalia massiliensis]